MKHEDNAVANRSILVVVDIQTNLLTQIWEKERLVAKTKLMIEGAKLLEIPIIVTQQFTLALGPTHPDLVEAMDDEYEPIEKISFDCFGEPAFEEMLSALHGLGRDTLVITGMETHICVQQTALSGIVLDFLVHLVTDAASSREEANWKIGMNKVENAGGILTSTECILFEWLKRAGTPEFKHILNLIK